ncbi:UNVERIFIED_CONTAM: Transcription factor GTE6 [Sesamum latifolium]|uniref:Transcription factor GTE6 n=1 Tax=Sesamum latifolium TaxID=2727402 RepID=A0AAW2UYM8_9LAMI
MKRKRGAGKRKSNKPSTGGAGEVFVEPGYYSDRNEENDELESRTEIETRAVHTKLCGQHAGLDNLATNNETVSGAVAKLARAISSSHVNPINDIVSQQRERIGQKEPKSSHQEPVYNKQELDAAHTVIKKIMKMEAAAPFNAPVDPIALGIPDYFDIIDTPMDFGTICSKLESGLKYRNSEEVFKDVELIWDNCCKYNKKGSLILELMKRVKTNFKRQWTVAGLHREQSTVTTGTLQVPPPTVLTGNCTKHTTESPRPPVTDDSGCRELNQINPIPEQSSSMINIMACHPVEKSCQNQPESSPSEHLHSTADNNFFKRITRGQTQIQCQEQSSSMMNSQKHQHQENTSKIPTISPESQPLPPTADHNRKWQRESGGQESTHGTAFGEGDRIPIPTNAQGQPVGPHAQKLVSFLGTLARNGHFLPLTYLDWRHVPSEKKKNMWEKVQLRFDIDPTSKNWVLQSLGRRWKDWKSKLKTAHYYPHETDEERLADCDERILPDQWAALVKLWSTESAQKNSATNRANRMKAKYIHASGRKSFARIREEQTRRSKRNI